MQNKFSSFYNGLSKKSKEIINTIFVLFMLLPHFQISILNNNGTCLDKVFNVSKIITALIIVVIYIYYSVKYKYFSEVYVIFFTIQSYIFINTTIQSGFNKDFFINYISSLILIMILDYFSKQKPKELIHSLLIIFEILISINFIFLVIYPNGIPKFNSHFLGNRNSHPVYITLALTFSLLWKNYNKKSLHFYVLLPISIISLIIGGSTTGIFALALFLLLYFTRLYKCKYTTVTLSFVIYIILFVLLVLFRVQNCMAPLWEAFGKNVTFTSRTLIWDRALALIPQKIIFGYGRLSDDMVFPLLEYYTVHNNILEHLFRGGIIQLLLILIFVIFVIKNVYKVRNEISTKILILGLIPLLLRALTESAQDPLYSVLFILLAHSGDFVVKAKSDSFDKELTMKIEATK